MKGVNISTGHPINWQIHTIHGLVRYRKQTYKDEQIEY